MQEVQQEKIDFGTYFQSIKVFFDTSIFKIPD